MPGNAIPKNATLAFLVESGRLRDRDKYVRGILNNMMLCRVEHKSEAIVRIGTTGEGVHPHYRVEPEGGVIEARIDLVHQMGEDDFTAEKQARREADMATTYYKAYDGRSHKQLKWGKSELQGYSWSDRSMNISQVQQLLGSVRGYKPKGK